MERVKPQSPSRVSDHNNVINVGQKLMAVKTFYFDDLDKIL